MRRAGAALGLLAMAACGGGGGGSPTSPGVVPPAATPRPSGWAAGTTVQLVDGDTGQPVAGTVVVAGVTTPAGAPLAAAAADGATVDVSAPGFLPRQTLVRTGETRLVLWPESATLPGDYTRSLVYTSVPAVRGGPPEVLASMRRLPTRVRTVAVTPSSSLQGDADALEAHRAAIDALNGVTAPLGVTYRLGGTGDFNLPTRLDPSATLCSEHTARAFTDLWLSTADEITRAEITFCTTSISATAGTILHELGHTFGLRHSFDPRDTMYPSAQSSRLSAPTPREMLTMSLMRARRPGTQWPDNDRQSTATAAVRLETVID